MKNSIFGGLSCLFLCIFLSACRFPTGSPAPSAPMVERKVTVGGVERSYLLYIPEKARGSNPVPAVLVFHGGLGRPENMPAVTGFNAKADEAGFVVAYPRGISRTGALEFDTWNGGLCCGWARQSNVDDVGFVRTLLDDLHTIVAVDDRRVFATGFSNGAILTYRLACELADRIAAIGPVAGTQNTAECHPSGAVAIIHFHGTGDKMVPYGGGIGQGVSGYPFAAVADTIAFWVQADGCPAASVRTDSGSFIHDVYAPCRDGAAVELYTIPGGPHGWPGGTRASATGDEPSQALNATDILWEFFAAHPKPASLTFS
jgi:polyhydroxybutyrate depolymerase